MTQRVLRVAFPPIGGQQWIGGQNYLFNLVRALQKYAADKVEPVLMVNHEYAPAEISVLDGAGVEVIRDDYFGQNNQTRRLMQAMIFGMDIGAAKRYRDARIDCVFENANYHGWRFPLPTLHWMPDFQHKGMPHLFGRGARFKRELGFRMASAKGRHIMLSSYHAKTDFETYYKCGSSLVHVVPFAVPRPPVLAIEKIADVARALNVRSKWFFLPNQLWKHKNHAIVIEALEKAVVSVPDMQVVCTGSTNDPRNPGHYDELTRLVKDKGLYEAFHILGTIEYAQVQALMQGATALINPSMFEGWSTVVEEAKALSLPMLLSNIDVHIEQAGEQADYFPPDDADALASLMINAWYASDSATRRTTQSGAVQRFAVSFVDAVQETVRSNAFR